jgi:DNA-directed RNA polymerase subunit N (RpoN/RPB10)
VPRGMAHDALPHDAACCMRMLMAHEDARHMATHVVLHEDA